MISHVGIRENCIDRCQPKHGHLAVVDIMLLETCRSFAADRWHFFFLLSIIQDCDVSYFISACNMGRI